MSDKIYDILPDAKARAFISNEKYLEMYDRQISVGDYLEKNGCAQFIRILMKLRITSTYL